MSDYFDNVKLVILSNGTTIIGKILKIDNVDEETDFMVLRMKDVFSLEKVMSEDGIIDFPIPFIKTTDEFIEIKNSMIMVNPCTPPKSILDAYIELTSTITIPKHNGLELIK